MNDFNPSSLVDYIKARNDAGDDVIVCAVPIPRSILYGASEADVISGATQMATTMMTHAVKAKRLYGEHATGMMVMNTKDTHA